MVAGGMSFGVVHPLQNQVNLKRMQLFMKQKINFYSLFILGVTDVCNWGVYENGDYWEECYCSHDGCNGSNQNRISTFAVVFGTIVTLCLAAVTAHN